MLVNQVIGTHDQSINEILSYTDTVDQYQVRVKVRNGSRCMIPVKAIYKVGDIQGNIELIIDLPGQ